MTVHAERAKLLQKRATGKIFTFSTTKRPKCIGGLEALIC